MPGFTSVVGVLGVVGRAGLVGWLGVWAKAGAIPMQVIAMAVSSERVVILKSPWCRSVGLGGSGRAREHPTLATTHHPPTAGSLPGGGPAVQTLPRPSSPQDRDAVDDLKAETLQAGPL